MHNYNIQRFIDAHRRSFHVALGEIKAGYKVSHWMWYIFPQIKGLGRSEIAEYYAIENMDEAIAYINKVGFLPLFKNDILGFSLEERTVPEFWWSGEPERDPWEWREIIARRGEVAYGKFFDKKARKRSGMNIEKC